MVVFTCGHCGEAVNKPKVEKHYLTKCRNRTPNLSCMDCFKDFVGKEYEPHTKCISEEQRYSAKGFVPKVNKGEAKQNAWVEMVQTVLEEQRDAPRSVIRIVEEISKHSNTPRKKPKFFNFVKNVCGHRTMPNDIEAAWDLISVKLSALSNSNNQNGKNNGTEKQQIGKEVISEDVTGKNNHVTMLKGEDNNVTMQEGEDNSGGTNGNTELNEVLTKKQRKEDKKRKKYEAELKSAAELPTEEVDESESTSKKGKKQNNTEQGSELGNVENDKVHKKGKKRKNTAENGVMVESQKITQTMENMNGEICTKKKRKVTEEAQENGEGLSSLHEQNVATEERTKNESSIKFDWNGTILSLLQKKGNEMPFKRLQKKILAEYAEVTGKEADERIADKLNKKLKSAPNVRVEKNRVLLVE